MGIPHIIETKPVERFVGNLAMSTLYNWHINREEFKEFTQKPFSDLPFFSWNYTELKKIFEETGINTEHLPKTREEAKLTFQYALIFAGGGRGRSSVIQETINGLKNTLEVMESKFYEDNQVRQMLKELTQMLEDYKNAQTGTEKESIARLISAKAEEIREVNKTLGYNYSEFLDTLSELITSFARKEQQLSQMYGELAEGLTGALFEEYKKKFGALKEAGKIVGEKNKKQIVMFFDRVSDTASTDMVEFLGMQSVNWDKDSNHGVWSFVERAKSGQMDKDLIVFMWHKYGGLEMEDEDRKRFLSALRGMGYITEQDEIDVIWENGQYHIKVRRGQTEIEFSKEAIPQALIREESRVVESRLRDEGIVRENDKIEIDLSENGYTVKIIKENGEVIEYDREKAIDLAGGKEKIEKDPGIDLIKNLEDRFIIENSSKAFEKLFRNTRYGQGKGDDYITRATTSFIKMGVGSLFLGSAIAESKEMLKGVSKEVLNRLEIEREKLKEYNFLTEGGKEGYEELRTYLTNSNTAVLKTLTDIIQKEKDNLVWSAINDESDLSQKLIESLPDTPENERLKGILQTVWKADTDEILKIRARVIRGIYEGNTQALLDILKDGDIVPEVIEEEDKENITERERKTGEETHEKEMKLRVNDEKYNRYLAGMLILAELKAKEETLSEETRAKLRQIFDPTFIAVSDTVARMTLIEKQKQGIEAVLKEAKEKDHIFGSRVIQALKEIENRVKNKDKDTQEKVLQAVSHIIGENKTLTKLSTKEDFEKILAKQLSGVGLDREEITDLASVLADRLTDKSEKDRWINNLLEEIDRQAQMFPEEKMALSDDFRYKRLRDTAIQYYNSALFVSKALNGKLREGEAYSILFENRGQLKFLPELYRKGIYEILVNEDVSPRHHIERLKELEERVKEDLQKAQQIEDEKLKNKLTKNYQTMLDQIEQVRKEQELREKIILKKLTGQKTLPLEQYMRTVKESFIMDKISRELNKPVFKIQKALGLSGDVLGCYEQALLPSGDAFERSVASKVNECFEKNIQRSKEQKERFKQLTHQFMHGEYSWTGVFMLAPLLLLEEMAKTIERYRLMQKASYDAQLRNTIRQIIERANNNEDVDRLVKDALYSQLGYKVNVYDRDLLTENYDRAKKLGLITFDKDEAVMIPLGNEKMIVIELDKNNPVLAELISRHRDWNRLQALESKPNRTPEEELLRQTLKNNPNLLDREKFKEQVLFAIGLDERELIEKFRTGEVKNGFELMESSIYQKGLFSVFSERNPFARRTKRKTTQLTPEFQMTR